MWTGTGVALLGTGVALLGTGVGVPGDVLLGVAGTVVMAGDAAAGTPFLLLEHLQLQLLGHLQHLQLLGQVPFAMVEDAHGCPEVELQTQQSDQSLCQNAMGLSCP